MKTQPQCGQIFSVLEVRNRDSYVYSPSNKFWKTKEKEKVGKKNTTLWAKHVCRLCVITGALNRTPWFNK